MIELVLKYIEDNNLVRYKDERWYSVKDYPRVYYKIEELTKLIQIRETRLKKVFPCVGHDMASWEEEDKLNKRIDIIGQNGNEGTHYDIQ
jgi:hypothetical protein